MLVEQFKEVAFTREEFCEKHKSISSYITVLLRILRGFSAYPAKLKLIALIKTALLGHFYDFYVEVLSKFLMQHAQSEVACGLQPSS